MPLFLPDLLTRDMFSVSEQTANMRKIKNNPRLISKSQLFSTKRIRTIDFHVQAIREEDHVLLAVARGSNGNTTSYDPADIHTMRSLYYPVKDFISADDIYSTGHLAQSDTYGALTTIQELMNEKQAKALRAFDITWEWQRCCALHGVVRNVPNKTLGQTTTSILYNLFEIFGVTEKSVAFPLLDPNGDIEAACTDVIDHFDFNGAPERTRTVAYCSPEFFKALVANPIVRDAFKRKNEGEFYWIHQRAFEFQDIWWVRYPGKAFGTEYWIKPNTCRFAAEGIPDLYQTVFSPADFIDAVGQPGQEFYFKNWARDDDRGIETLAVTTATSLCTRPELLVEGTIASFEADPPNGDEGGGGDDPPNGDEGGGGDDPPDEGGE